MLFFSDVDWLIFIFLIFYQHCRGERPVRGADDPHCSKLYCTVRRAEAYGGPIDFNIPERAYQMVPGQQFVWTSVGHRQDEVGSPRGRDSHNFVCCGAPTRVTRSLGAPLVRRLVARGELSCRGCHRVKVEPMAGCTEVSLGIPTDQMSDGRSTRAPRELGLAWIPVDWVVERARCVAPCIGREGCSTISRPRQAPSPGSVYR